ncbi:hypothetical protein GH714_031150 [Hevea brasiliensis]|uniref:RWD domain-containing protein n=1 Tax=Hevea brasiliensis TaxID=3981 RepID=A0A6A6LP02_HEVBR|nr:hypothetical protein GH714_031150 [Hevea brasiliensis]
MEIEALEAILMDDFKEIHSSESGLDTSNRCFQITISPQDDDADDPMDTPVSSYFSHTEKYPDESPLLNVKRVQYIDELCVATPDFLSLSSFAAYEASENLGMAMIYTLVTSAKEWLSEKYGQDASNENIEDEQAAKEDIIVPHGEAVTVDTFLAWRERFEAELALERAKLMPESALTAPKEKKLTGRQWFESGGANHFLFDMMADDEEDMLEHYLAEKSDSSCHSSRRAN